MERVGKFELHAKLGEGGFGRVWKAMDTDLGVWRALKEPFDQSDEMEKELKEARIQALLDHPGIVRVLAIERIDGRFLMVMEFADGPNLRQVIKEQGKMAVEEADNILRGILEALQYAHSKGVAHLDLKPENVFCTTDGRFKLGDFGLARISDRAMSTLSVLVNRAPNSATSSTCEGSSNKSVWVFSSVNFSACKISFSFIIVSCSVSDLLSPSIVSFSERLCPIMFLYWFFKYSALAE